MFTRTPRTIAIFSSILAVSLILSACGSLGINFGSKTATPVENALGTSAAQTLAANPPPVLEATQIPLLAPVIPTDTEVPASTQPQAPSQTQAPQSPSQTEVPQAPSATQPPAGVLMVTASLATNCRMGPSPDYPVLGALGAGQSVPALGRNDSNSWWLIQDPSDNTMYCWVWGATAQLQGDPSSLQVVVPPPPPPSLPEIPNIPGLPLP